jgi:GGDEF domain-containing protein
VAERVLAALSRPMLIEGRELVVRASVGVATAAPGDDADTVMRAAHLALYRAKAAGKAASRTTSRAWNRRVPTGRASTGR